MGAGLVEDGNEPGGSGSTAGLGRIWLDGSKGRPRGVRRLD